MRLVTSTEILSPTTSLWSYSKIPGCMTTESPTLTSKSESKSSEDAWKGIVTTRITPKLGRLQTSLWSILEPPIGTEIQTYKEKSSIFQMLLDRSSTWILCSRVSTQLQATSLAGETISFKLCTIWSIYLTLKTLGCTSFQIKKILSPRWEISNKRQLRRTFVQGKDAAASPSYAKKPTRMNMIPSPDTESLSSSWRTSSWSWMWYLITSSHSCSLNMTL